jgi:hypothetical protein
VLCKYSLKAESEKDFSQDSGKGLWLRTGSLSSEENFRSNSSFAIGFVLAMPRQDLVTVSTSLLDHKLCRHPRVKPAQDSNCSIVIWQDLEAANSIRLATLAESSLPLNESHTLCVP